jgi:hypothetical protein
MFRNSHVHTKLSLQRLSGQWHTAREAQFLQQRKSPATMIGLLQTIPMVLTTRLIAV